MGNGYRISLWHDRWIDLDPIAALFPNLDLSPFPKVSTIIEEIKWRIPDYIPLVLQVHIQCVNSILIAPNSIDLLA